MKTLPKGLPNMAPPSDRFFLLICLIVVLALALTPSKSSAQTTWTTTNTGMLYWSTAGNWNNGVPTASVDATLATGSLTISNAAEAKSIIWSLTNANGVLTIGAGGSLTLDNGNGTFSVTGVTNTTLGTITVNSTNTAGTAINAASVVARGLSVSAGSAGQTAYLTIASGQTYDLTQGTTGSQNLSAANTANRNGDVTIQGTVKANTVNMGASTSSTATATQRLDGGTLSVRDGLFGNVFGANTFEFKSGTLSKIYSSAAASSIMGIYGATNNTLKFKLGSNGTRAFDTGTNSGNGILMASTTEVSDLTSNGSMQISGSGVFRLQSAAAHSGDTVLRSGTLEVQNAAAQSATANATVSGTTLSNLSSTAGLFVGQMIYGSGIRYGAFITSINTNNNTVAMSQTASATTNGTTLTFAGASGSFSNSTLDIQGGAVSFGFSTDVTFGGLKGSVGIALTNTNKGAVSLTVGGNNQSTEYSGGLSGSGALTKTGTGTLTLSGTNSYVGNTIVNGGALQLGNGGATGRLGTSSSISISNGAKLIFNRSNDVTQGTDFSSGAISGAGGVVKLGAGALTLNAGNTYTGGTTISNGAVVLSAADSLGNVSGNLTFDGASTLRLGASFSSARNYVLNAQGTIDTAGNNLTHSGVISGASELVKIGSGTLILQGDNTYAGNTTVNAGELALSGRGRLGAGTGAVSIGGGMLNLGGMTRTNASFTITSGALNNGAIVAATYALNGGTVAANLGAGTLNVGGDAALSGTSLAEVVNINSGMLTLGSANRLNAGANVNLTGVLNLGANNQTVSGLTGGGVVTSSTGSTLTVTKSLGSTESFSGAIRGAGGFIKNGAGTFKLTGSSNKITTTTVNDGVLVVNGALESATTVAFGGTLGGTGSITSVTVASGGTLAPGNSPGLQAIGALTLEGGGKLDWEMANFTGARGLGWDAIDAGSLNFFNISSGNKFTINIKSYDFEAPPNWNFTSGTNYSYAVIKFGASDTPLEEISGLIGLNISGFDGLTGADGYNWSLTVGAFEQQNAVYLNYAIPEPSTYALLVLAGIGFAGHVIRCRHRNRLNP